MGTREGSWIRFAVAWDRIFGFTQARGRSAAGSASPCQGEGRGFESRRPLEGVIHTVMVEWPRGEATACKAVYTGSNPVSTSKNSNPQHLGRLAQGLARFLDMEEVTGSIPVSPTHKKYYSATGFEDYIWSPFLVCLGRGPGARDRRDPWRTFKYGARAEVVRLSETVIPNRFPCKVGIRHGLSKL